MPVATPFWTTGLPRTPTPRERVIRDLQRRMNSPQSATFGSLKVTQILTIENATPQLRFKENDQAAPAGEYRQVISADQLSIERALTAGYASVIKFLKFDYSGSIRRMIADEALRVHWDNANLQIWHNDGVRYTGDATSGSYTFGHLDNASVHTDVFKIAAASDPSGANFPYAQFINRPLFLAAGLAGDAISDLEITPNYNNTGTGRSLLFSLRNTVGSQITAWRAFPNGASPIISQIAPNIVPTTTQIPNATFLTFIINGSDELVAYFNKAGAIISRNLGVLA